MAFTGGDTFAYDLSGNPTDHGAVLGAGDRLTQFNGYTLGYDPDGNLTSKTKAGYTQTLTWNSLGQLASVTTNGVTVSYGYDGLGKRVRRRINGADAGYLYDGDDLLLEYDGNGVQAKYAYYPSGEPHSVLRDGQTYYYATDVQGSVLALFNTSNTVVNQYSYLPFGEAQTATEGVANRLRYTGRELESESGLYYNNARWYDPQLHRFISEDPIGIDGGLDLYAYVGNDPVNFDDPFGLFMGKPKCPATAEEAIRRGQAYCLATLIVNGGWSGDELFWFLVSSASHNSAQGPIAGESLGPNSSSGHRYSRCEVAGILTDLVATLRQNPGSFFPHYNPRFDFRAGDENEHGQDNLRNQYQVGGVWLRSDQFGNFAAGYAGERVYGHAGWAAMRFGGFLYALWRTSNEDWLDLASASMINAGADRADQEAAASSTGTRGIGVVLRRPAPPVALTSRYGCRSK
jgi:RHS repeat-associated protein